MSSSIVFRCQNPTCRREKEVPRAAAGQTANPRCTCGAAMKKVYVAPRLQELTQAEAEELLRDGSFAEYSTGGRRR